MFSHKTKAFALLAAPTLIFISLIGARDAHSATQTSAPLFFVSHPFQIHSSTRLITEDSVGPVRLGMTVTQARKSLPGFTLSRTSDGEGLALIAVKRGGKTLMTLYAGEANPDARINEGAVIEFVEAWDAGYRTAAGVHPTMPLREVERKYGKLEETILSEIEQREFATFANQPAGISLRVMNENGLAGLYSDGQRRTSRYAPSAYVFRISIHGARNKRPHFSSTYTDLKTQCKNPAKPNAEGQHSSLFCRGVGNYRIHIFDSAMALHINAETLDRQTSIPLAEQNLTYDRQGRRIEWRLANGKPFAVILRVFKYSGQGQYPLQEKPTGEVLLVKGLGGYERIDYEVDVKSNANPNAKAREMADNAYAEASAQLKRNEGESLEGFARRIIPSGSRLAHQALEGKFGSSSKSVVILFSEEKPASSYQGWVLIPVGDGFERYALPEPEVTWSIESPKAIFFANADKDADHELFILAECYTGIGPTGAEPFHRTRVYDWKDGFVHLEAVSKRIGPAATAAGARKKIGAVNRTNRNDSH